MSLFVRYSIFALLPLPLTISPAHACVVSRPLTEEQISRADVLFVGTPVIYKRNAPEERLGPPVEITFKVKSVLHGKIKGETIDVYWVNGTFGEPQTLSEFKEVYGPTVTVGLVSTKTYLGWCRPVHGQWGDGRPVTSTSCRGEFIGGHIDRPPHRPYILNNGCSESLIVAADCKALLAETPIRGYDVTVSKERNMAIARNMCTILGKLLPGWQQ